MRDDYKRHKRAASLRSRFTKQSRHCDNLTWNYLFLHLFRFSATEAPDLASLQHFSLAPQNVSVKEKVFQMGYNDLRMIPPGATNILITEVRLTD